MHHTLIDNLSFKDSPIHRLDSRVKLVASVIYTALVISLGRTSVTAVFCFAVGPFAMLVLGEIPVKFVFKHILFVSPFVLVFALTCPLYDNTTQTFVFGTAHFEVSVGWMRCFTILAKFVTTMFVLMALVCTTRFSDLLAALQWFRVPSILVIQLGFLYRYIYVLTLRSHQVMRSWKARKFRYLGFRTELKTAASVVGSLLIGGIDRAERISRAMQGRGFDGRWQTMTSLGIHAQDLFFISASILVMLFLYFYIKPVLL